MIKYKNDYTEKDFKMINAIVTPKGRFVKIQNMSHTYYLSKLFEEEFETDIQEAQDKLHELRMSGKYTSRISLTDVLIKHYRFISIHTSGFGYGWIQGPPEISSEQLSSAKHQHVLGEVPALLLDILEAWDDPDAWYNTRDEKYREGVYTVKQADIKKPSESTRKLADIERGYFVHIMP